MGRGPPYAGYATRAGLGLRRRGKRPATDAAPVEVSSNDEPRSPEEKRRAMTWAQRLKRVFSIDVTPCVHCGGAARMVASIEEPAVIRATWPTSTSTVRGKKRTTGPQRAPPG